MGGNVAVGRRMQYVIVIAPQDDDALLLLPRGCVAWAGAGRRVRSPPGRVQIMLYRKAVEKEVNDHYKCSLEWIQIRSNRLRKFLILLVVLLVRKRQNRYSSTLHWRKASKTCGVTLCCQHFCQ